jgi:hypothetical protein
MGRLAPGFLEAGKIFTKMWRECGTNREKYGCEFPLLLDNQSASSTNTGISVLGKTSTLMGSQEKGGMTMVWITYWKDI